MGWKSIGVLALVMLTTPTEAVGRDFSRTSLVIRIYNNYGIPADDLSAARAQVDAIFNDAGIGLSWLDCWDRGKVAMAASPECLRPLDKTDVVLRLQGGQPVPGGRYVSMGFSLVNLEGGVPFLATVFADLVASISRTAAVDFRLLLGRAIAHEIGHLLLNTSLHASRGLMRADWSRVELRRENASDWGFVEEEVAAIRTSAMSRNSR
jgi:hypothetical protein